jgi:hypothetical protein
VCVCVCVCVCAGSVIRARGELWRSACGHAAMHPCSQAAVSCHGRWWQGFSEGPGCKRAVQPATNPLLEALKETFGWSDYPCAPRFVFAGAGCRRARCLGGRKKKGTVRGQPSQASLRGGDVLDCTRYAILIIQKQPRIYTNHTSPARSRFSPYPIPVQKAIPLPLDGFRDRRVLVLFLSGIFCHGPDSDGQLVGFREIGRAQRHCEGRSSRPAPCPSAQ